MRRMDVLRPAESSFLKKSPQKFHFSFPLFQESTRGQFSSVWRVRTIEDEAGRSLYLHQSPGAHYPDSITHAQTALCGVFLLIDRLNDVESFKTNSVSVLAG